VTTRDEIVAALLAERFGGPPVREYKNERRCLDSEVDQAAHDASVWAVAARVKRNPGRVRLTAAQQAVTAYEAAQQGAA
jgi:hypothetical protein